MLIMRLFCIYGKLYGSPIHIGSNACAVYVISYIGKSQRGMSKLLRDALMHLKAGNTTIKERMRGIAYKFQSCSEVSAQKVSHHLLSLSVIELMCILTPILQTSELAYSGKDLVVTI